MGEILDNLSAFELLAELGLGLAGFAGVAAAFAGRARSYDQIDVSRMLVLFVAAGVVVAGSLAVISLVAIGLDTETTYRVVSSCTALFIAAAAIPMFRIGLKNSRERPNVAPPYALVVGAAYLLAFETLLMLSLFRGGNAGFLVAALSLTLVYGLWAFVRLLMRPTQE